MFVIFGSGWKRASLKGPASLKFGAVTEAMLTLTAGATVETGGGAAAAELEVASQSL